MERERLIGLARQGLKSAKELVKSNKAASLCTGLSGGLALSDLALQTATEFKASLIAMNVTTLGINAVGIGLMKLKSKLNKIK